MIISSVVMISLNFGVVTASLALFHDYFNLHHWLLPIDITTPDMLEELARYADVAEQKRIVLLALDIGLKTMSALRGEIDAQALYVRAE